MRLCIAVILLPTAAFAVTDHAALDNLRYEQSGHIGFARLHHTHPEYISSYDWDIDANDCIDLAAGGTNASLSDPDADRIFFWDDSNGVTDWLIIGTGLTLTDMTLTASAGSGDMLKSVYDHDEDGDVNVAAGGTEKSAWTQYCIPYLDTTTSFSEIAIGTANQYLKVANPATGYGWDTLDDSDIDFTGWTGVSSITTVGTIGTGTWQGDDIALGTRTSGNYVKSITNGTGISGGDGGSEGAELTLSVTGLTVSEFASANVSQWTNDAGYITSGGSTTFVGLTDTPANYTSAADKLVTVNHAANALVFHGSTLNESTGKLTLSGSNADLEIGGNNIFNSSGNSIFTLADDGGSSPYLSQVAPLSCDFDCKASTAPDMGSTGVGRWGTVFCQSVNISSSITGTWGTVSTTELGYLDGVTSDIQTQLNAVSSHAILDGSIHSDSVADAVTRGSLIYGNATPKWDELVVSTGFLNGDGTDVAWKSYEDTMGLLSGEAGAAFDMNSQNVTGIGSLTATTLTDGTASLTGGAWTAIASAVVDNITVDGSGITHDAGTTADFTIANADQDKDIVFSVNDGGATKTMTLDASEFRWVPSTGTTYFSGDVDISNDLSITGNMTVNQINTSGDNIGGDGQNFGGSSFDLTGNWLHLDYSGVGRIGLEGTVPVFAFGESDGALNEKLQMYFMAAGTMFWRTYDDDGSLKNTAYSITTDGDVKFEEQVFADNLTSSTGTALLITAGDEIVKDSSSARYKTDIEDLPDSNAIYELRPRIYKRISDPNGPNEVGIVAEEAAEVMPEIVIYKYDKIIEKFTNELGQPDERTIGYEKTDQPDAISWPQLTTRLLQALQKQEAQIAALEARVEKLEKP